MVGASYLNELEARRRPTVPACISLALHVVVLAWLLHRPAPRFISPSSVANGEAGTSVTFLFHPDPAGGSQASAVARQAVIFRQKSRAKKKDVHSRQKPDSLAEQKASEAANAAPPVGSRFGSQVGGPITGSEVRPALRVSGSEPSVGLDELRGAEGNVIVEITIDEHGMIVSKNVIQSLNATIDNKVLAALEDWHFLPATEDGVAIPSKEDVYYHFPVRR